MVFCMINLSPQQEAVVKGTIGCPVQVLASAGAGKTRVLTERIRHILSETKKDGVIALTFTNKAAEEMQNRLSDIEDAATRCWISTIHSVAQRILDQYGNTIGLPKELHIYEREQDRKTVFVQSLINSGVGDLDVFLNSRDERDRDRKIQKYMDQISAVKRNLLTENEIKDISTDEDGFSLIFNGYQDTLLESGGIDFDDILVYAHKILLEQPWCGDIYRAKYKHICVDEAQDLNKAQYEFIKALCADRIKSVMMVGDPNQMIYGFNGSSHDFLCLYFINDFSPLCYQLKENYRSSKTVIRLANKLRPNSQIENNFALQGKSEIIECADENDEANWIFSKIEDILNLHTDEEIEGPITPDKIVVIARNRYVLQNLEAVLSEKQIVCTLKKGERQSECTSVFGKVLDLSIRLRLNTKDWIDGKKLCFVLNVPIPSDWSQEKILNALADEVMGVDVMLPELQAAVLRAVQTIDTEKPNVLKLCNELDGFLKNLAEKLRGSDELLAELERSLLELNEFRKCWTSFRLKGLGESLLSFRNAMALGQLSEDIQTGGLTLSTVHTMKGLEKDVVFLAGMCEGIFPDYRASSRKEIEEEQNNAFVAVTRARRWIYITYPRQRKMPWGDIKQQKPSRFIYQMQSEQ